MMYGFLNYENLQEYVSECERKRYPLSGNFVASVCGKRSEKQQWQEQKVVMYTQPGNSSLQLSKFSEVVLHIKSFYCMTALC